MGQKRRGTGKKKHRSSHHWWCCWAQSSFQFFNFKWTHGKANEGLSTTVVETRVVGTYVNDIVLGIMCICAAHVQPGAMLHLLDYSNVVPAIEQLQNMELNRH